MTAAEKFIVIAGVWLFALTIICATDSVWERIERRRNNRILRRRIARYEMQSPRKPW